MQRGDGIYQDKYNHASLIDAGLLAEATLKRYQHTNLAHLHAQMAKQTTGHKLIVTDSVFSMAGDLAPLPELVQLAKQHDAWLMVDDAHGIGILGNAGAGVCEQFGLSQAEVPILVCPLGKAFGGLGAVVAGSHALIEALIQFARTYIYSTAIPPAIASAMQMSLQLIQTEPERRAKLQSNIAYFREAASARNLAFMPSATPIQCLLVGDINTTMQLSQDLLAKGFVVGAMRPPTVPVNMARLRITLSCLHEQSDMDALLDAIVMSPVYATN
jgi:8-amino-7-oxononanoate synthase